MTTITVKKKQKDISSKKLEQIKQEMLHGDSYDREDVKKFLDFQKILHGEKVENKII